MKFCTLFLLGVGLLAGLPLAASAETPTTGVEVSGAAVTGVDTDGTGAEPVDLSRVEDQLLNPCENCGGKPLSGSYCGTALELKAEVREMAEAGIGEQQILDSFVAEYGAWILTLPERSGFNLLAWVLPAAGMVVGAFLLLSFLRRANGRTSCNAATAEGSAPEEGELAAEGRVADIASSTVSRQLYRDRLAKEIADV